jgi:hypothetical protein
LMMFAVSPRTPIARTSPCSLPGSVINIEGV